MPIAARRRSHEETELPNARSGPARLPTKALQVRDGHGLLVLSRLHQRLLQEPVYRDNAIIMDGYFGKNSVYTDVVKG